MGGFVRDRIEDKPSRDLDLEVSGAPDGFSRALAERTGGTWVPLDPERGTFRVALRDPPGVWVDVAARRGRTIQDDLRARDYTVNALALPLAALVEEPLLSGARAAARALDPEGGVRDLAARTVRMVSEDNLAADPLRGLRGVRLAAELSGTVEPETLSAIARHASSLSRAAAERIRDELVRLFSARRTASWVRLLDRLGLGAAIWPESLACRGVAQNPYHHLDVYEHSLLTLARAEGIARSPARFFPEDGPEIALSLARPMGGAAARTYLKLASLLHDVGKPACRTVESGGRVRFLGHETEGERTLDGFARRLRLPADGADALARWTRHHLRAGNLAPEGGPTRRTAYRFFRDLGELAEGAVVLSLADRLAARGDGFRALRPAQLASLRRLLAVRRVELRRIPAVRFLNGDDLLGEFGLAPGPAVGALLSALDEAAAAGEVTDERAARAFVRRRLDDPEGG